MLILIAAYLAGALTILSPCILPIVPFVFAHADRPFRSHGLPLLIGLAVAFTVLSTLAVVGGGWIVTLDHYGRDAALALLAFFGATLLFPALADRLTRPLVAAGARWSAWPAPGEPERSSMGSSLVVGVATGLLWAPCAGPVLGLVLTGAAIDGASLDTTLLLAAYAAGACTSLALALLFGRRMLSAIKRGLGPVEWVRRFAGAAVLVACGAIALGYDTSVLSRWSIDTTAALERSLLDAIVGRPLAAAGPPSNAARGDVPGTRDAVEGTLPSLSGAVEWINTSPLTADGLRGKVVLVDFWTYSCINCLRTLPYVRAWAAKYRDAGLVVIGVHTPEFAFEKRSANVHRAIRDHGIDFSVAVDSDFAIWRAFGNQYWPAFYFVDAEGRVRHHQFGEGGYDESERVIQRLLAETGRTNVASAPVAPEGAGVERAPGPVPPASDETYLGFDHGARRFASPDRIVRDRSLVYRSAASLAPGQWTLAGAWTVKHDHVLLDREGGRIAFRFHARDLHLVLGAADGVHVRFRVTIDGRPPGSAHGADIDADGVGTIDGQRLYQLVRQVDDEGDHAFEIEFLDAGAEAYVFTFG